MLVYGGTWRCVEGEQIESIRIVLFIRAMSLMIFIYQNYLSYNLRLNPISKPESIPMSNPNSNRNTNPLTVLNPNEENESVTIMDKNLYLRLNIYFESIIRHYSHTFLQWHVYLIWTFRVILQAFISTEQFGKQDYYDTVFIQFCDVLHIVLLCVWKFCFCLESQRLSRLPT